MDSSNLREFSPDQIIESVTLLEQHPGWTFFLQWVEKAQERAKVEAVSGLKLSAEGIAHIQGRYAALTMVKNAPAAIRAEMEDQQTLREALDRRKMEAMLNDARSHA